LFVEGIIYLYISMVACKQCVIEWLELQGAVIAKYHVQTNNCGVTVEFAGLGYCKTIV
jgi:hypothetical protein